MPRGNVKALSLGPGYLYINALTGTEPTDLTTAWTALTVPWTPLGYTEEGSSFSYQTSSDNIEVAEELDPVGRASTGREASVSFALAEITAANLKIAMNGGTIVASGTGATAIKTFEPPELGTETSIMLGFESEDHLERWVFRQGLQTGTVEMARRKGADKTTIAAEFSLSKPATGAKLFKAIISDSRLAA